MKTTTPKQELYAHITDAVIAMLESGKTSKLTWARTGNGLPCNHQTGAAYQGVNVLLLWAAAMTHGYASDRWLTYKQAAGMGGQIRKGEKSVMCVFFKRIVRKSKSDGDSTKESESVRVMSPFWLFNLDQIDGIEAPQATVQLNEFQQIEAAESVLIHSGAVIREQGQKAFYRPSTDEIYLPERAPAMHR